MSTRSSSNVLTGFNSITQMERYVFSEFIKTCHSNIFWVNKKGLIYQSTTYDFDNSKWDKNPLQFCKDKYSGKQYIYPIILMVNNIDCAFSFQKDNLPNGIITPDVTVISRLTEFITD